MIVAVRFHGSALPPVALVESRRLFSIGLSPDCDLVVPSEVAIGVAAVHGIVERTDGGIIVRDHQAHGLYRSRRSARVSELHIAAGGVGWIGGCPVLALDASLVTLRHRLAISIGLDAHAAVDDAIVAVADGVPLALVGPRNLDALPLARAIHDSGPARDRSFTVEDATVPRIDTLDGTIVVDLDSVRRLPAAHVAELLATHCAARVIFLASRPRVLLSRLDSYTPRVRPIDLVPLARRSDEIGRLLALVWRDELGNDRRVDDLGARSLRGLAAYRWPQNLDELRGQAARILAYSIHSSLRRAAAALGIKHQTLGQHLARIGVVILDPADRETAPPPRPERSTP